MPARQDTLPAPTRLLATLALATLAFLALAPAAGAKGKRWTSYTRPATHEPTRETNVPIPMRDGVVLRANVDRPAKPGHYPTLVIQTPYNKDGVINTFLGGTAQYFVRRGYAVVTVDVRGTGSSEGAWDSFGPAEQRDGYDVVEWAARQPWSNGRVGGMGPSYMAITQLTTAAQRPPHLEAIFPVVPMADSYRDITFSGGQVNLAFIPFWLGLVTVGNLTPLPSADDPLGFVETLLEHLLGVLDFQVPTVIAGALGADLAFDGEFWKTRSPIELVRRIKVPAFVVGGHHDLFQRGEPLVYEQLKRRVPARLLMGPWNHIQGSTGEGLPSQGLPSLNDIQLRWFDRWLLGKRKRTRIGRIPKVTQYAYGRKRWVTQRDWPDPRLRPVRRYLRAGGRLSAKPARADEPGQALFQDPLAGICTLSTDQWTAGLASALPCTGDGRDHEQGAARYETPPLRRKLELSGPILANLWVTTTAADAVLTVRLKDVAPDGRVTELTSGWLAASFRAVDRKRSRYVKAPGGGKRLLQPWHPYTLRSVLGVREGTPIRMPIEVFPTRATLLPGHKLRLTVSGGDFPHQLPPLPQFAASLGGRVEILNAPRRRSYLELPGLRRKCAKRCEPLPVPRLLRGR